MSREREGSRRAALVYLRELVPYRRWEAEREDNRPVVTVGLTTHVPSKWVLVDLEDGTFYQPKPRPDGGPTRWRLLQ